MIPNVLPSNTRSTTAAADNSVIRAGCTGNGRHSGSSRAVTVTELQVEGNQQFLALLFIFAGKAVPPDAEGAVEGDAGHRHEGIHEEG